MAIRDGFADLVEGVSRASKGQVKIRRGRVHSSGQEIRWEGDLENTPGPYLVYGHPLVPKRDVLSISWGDGQRAVFGQADSSDGWVDATPLSEWVPVSSDEKPRCRQEGNMVVIVGCLHQPPQPGFVGHGPMDWICEVPERYRPVRAFPLAPIVLPGGTTAVPYIHTNGRVKVAAITSNAQVPPGTQFPTRGIYPLF